MMTNQNIYYAKGDIMKNTKGIILFISLIIFALAAQGLFAGSADQNDEADKIFQSLDKNHDGKISREEWDAVDVNKDGTITPEEMAKYHFKSSRSVRWIDTNSDGYMDRYEFRENFRK